MSGRTRVVVAAAAGNIIEWYDFAIYGYFAISIGRTFFPLGDPVVQVMAAFGVFAAGYLMRPLGAVLTGIIADRRGRLTALSISAATMAVPTFVVGLLPGYDVLGEAAPLLLILCRMVQGLAAGGECTTSFTFLIENAPPHRRGLFGAVAIASNNLGMLLGSASGAVLASLLTVEALHDWGWRMPFLLTLALGVVGYLLRRSIPESGLPTHGGNVPIGRLFLLHRRLIVQLCGLAAFASVSYYLMFLYVVSWLQLVDGLPPQTALTVNTGSFVVLIVATLGAGWLSDRVGRKPMLLAGMIAGFVLAVPLLWLMHHPDTVLLLLGQLGFVLIVSCAVGVQPAMMVESTPREARCTAIALAFNLSYGVLGGLSPLAAAWLIHRSGLDLSPAFMIMAASAVAVVAVLSLKEPQRRAPL